MSTAVKVLERKIKELSEMNEFRWKMIKDDELEIIKLKEAVAELKSKGVE